MTGYGPLLDLRRARVQPSLVCITDGTDPFSKDWHDQVAGRSQQYHAHIQVDQQDTPEALDLRALIGLVVMVAGERTEDRTRRLFEAVKASKPLAAIALLANETLFFDSRQHG